MAQLTKLVYCVRKRAELSDDEFRTYWLEQHGPLVRSLWEAGRFPGMVKYVQSLPYESISDPRQADPENQRERM